MFRYFLILFTIIFLSLKGESQSSFQVTFKSPLNEYFSNMIEDHNGNYLAVGSQRFYNQFNTNNGILWRITYNGDTISKVFNFGDTVSSFNLVLLSNNCYCTVIASLIRYSDDTTYYTKILEFDNNLNIVNQRTLQPFPYDYAGFNALLSSNTAYYGIGVALDEFNIFNPCIIKFNHNFDVFKIQAYPFYSVPGVFNSGNFIDAVFSPDSSQLWVFSEYLTPGNNSLNDLVVVDTSLNFISIKEFPVGQYPNFGYLDGRITTKMVTDSTFLVAGNYWHQNYPALLQQDIGFAEYDSTLSVSNVHVFGTVDTVDYGGFNRTFDFVNSDSIYFTGTKRLGSDFFPHEVSWIYAGMFNREFQLYFERFYGGDAHYWASSIIRTSDGGFLISGNRYDYLTQNNERDVFFLKLDAEGLITSDEESQQCPYLPFAIYPNPGTDILYLDLVIREAQFSLVDINGKQIKKALIKEGENHINCSDLIKGCYIVNVVSPSGEVFTKKWIKQ